MHLDEFRAFVLYEKSAILFSLQGEDVKKEKRQDRERKKCIDTERKKKCVDTGEKLLVIRYIRLLIVKKECKENLHYLVDY